MVDKDELIARLYAMLTAMLEDSAAKAAEGQGPEPAPARFERAQALEAEIRDAHTIVQSIAQLSACHCVSREPQ